MSQISATGTQFTRVARTLLAAAGSVTITGLDAGSGANRRIVVAITWMGANGHTISSITFGALGLTAKGAAHIAENNCRQRLYTAAAPTGSGVTLTVNHSAGAGDSGAVIDVYFAEDSSQDDAACILTVSQGTDSSGALNSVLAVSSETGSLVIQSHGARCSGGASAMALTGITERGALVTQLVGGVTVGVRGGSAAGAATVTGTGAWSGGTFAINYVCSGLNIPNVSGGVLDHFDIVEESNADLGNFTVGTTRNIKLRALDENGDVVVGFVSTVAVSAVGANMSVGDGTSAAFTVGELVLAAAFDQLGTDVEIACVDTTTGLIPGGSVPFDVVVPSGGAGSASGISSASPLIS